MKEKNSSMDSYNLKQLFSKIKQAYLEDQYLLRKKLNKLIALSKRNSETQLKSSQTSSKQTSSKQTPSKNVPQKNAHISNNESGFIKQVDALSGEIEKSIQRIEQRKNKLPPISYTQHLPVSLSIDKIRDAFVKHQVIIVASETGSGKTTQLPKMCLEAGRGVRAKIAHTQPRRIAAISVASRIASEMNSEVGEYIGYKVRFQDTSSDNCYIKLMTDGMLLAEIQQDHFLNQYDTVIIDEAHERSLNIDFLLGYLKKILPKRPDLKVIITSATINTAKFSAFFHDAPVIEVSGKLWPVDIRYHAPDLDILEEGGVTTKTDINEQIVDAVTELFREGPGDILLFFSGEKEIRECLDVLRSRFNQEVDCIPLYARLTAAEQKRIFHTGQKRRLILSTNIAETSVTVPGIQFVIDTGTARISRYSVKNKIQLLPIEKISQASAKQRSGRCGRVSAGIAIRLYAEDDFNLRPLFTEAEILRTNLAQVILQMLRLRLGNVQDFDFIDKPQLKNINDGYSLLLQLGAILSYGDKKNPQYKLTPLGHQVSQLNIDPKLAVVLMESINQHSLPEVLVIVSALSCQDPREVPKEKQQKAREKHQPYVDKRSDFITLINIWNDFQLQSKALSQNKFRKYCYAQFLSYNRLREWQEIVVQLKRQLKNMRLNVETALLNKSETFYKAEPTEMSTESYLSIHKALISGLFQSIAIKDDKNNYMACRNLNLKIHPGSGLSKKQPKWILASEIVETNQVFARKAAYVEPLWIEHQTEHLLKKHYYEPCWEKKIGKVMGKAKLSLFGLVINPSKKVNFGEIDPVLSHEIFIKEALLTGEYTDFRGRRPNFLEKNLSLIEEVQKLEHKSRRHDILVDDTAIVSFYQSKLDGNICTRSGFERWLKKLSKKSPDYLLMTEEDLMQNEAEHVSETLYPSSLQIKDIEIKLEYHFLPGHPLDGVTAIIPLALLNKVEEKYFSRLVPGMIREKVELMFRSLPKVVRKVLLPINDKITLFLQSDSYNNPEVALKEAFISFVTDEIRSSFKAREALGEHPLSDFLFPYHLLMNYRLVETLDVDSKQEKKASQQKRNKKRQQQELINMELECSRDFSDIQHKWSKKAEQALLNSLEQTSNLGSDDSTQHPYEKSGIMTWDFGDLEEQVTIEKWGTEVQLYPALVDDSLNIGNKDIKINTISIKLFDTKEKANLSMQQGLFKLYYLACESQIRSLLNTKANQLNFSKLCLSAGSLGNKEKITQQFIGHIVNTLFQPEQLIYTQQAYQEKMSQVSNNQHNHNFTNKNGEYVEEVIQLIKLLSLIFSEYRAVKKLIKSQTNLSVLSVVKDLNNHLDNLFHPSFIQETPNEWLKRYTRYMQVIGKRLEKVGQDPRRDNLLQVEINELEEQYEIFIKNIKWTFKCQMIRDKIINYRWLLEELRLSLFAQELKTIQPISVTRMNKLWLEIKASCDLNLL